MTTKPSLERVKEIRDELDDVEWYTPTVPMRWERYHELIRELCTMIEVNQKEKPVSFPKGDLYDCSKHTLPRK